MSWGDHTASCQKKLSLRKEPVARYVGEIEPGRRRFGQGLGAEECHKSKASPGCVGLVEESERGEMRSLSQHLIESGLGSRVVLKLDAVVISGVLFTNEVLVFKDYL